MERGNTVFQSFFMLMTASSRASAFVELAVESADVRFAVVGPLARGVVVMDEHPQPRTGAAVRPFEHLEVAVGVAERGDRPPTDVQLMPTGLPALSSMKSISGSRTSTGLPSRTSYFVLMLLPTTCSGGMP